MYRDIKHFPNLTTLRFIAAYFVVIFHIEETRKMFGMPNLTRYSLFSQGPVAVTFFFVLSGFLISYLLLRERAESGQIRVGRFYARRILRIWPLYFLLVFIGLVIIPAAVRLGRVRYEAPFESMDVALYFVLFVPFIVNLTYGNHFLTPLWSVGLEEVFYLVWAPVMKWMRRHLLAIAAGTVIAKTVLCIWARYAFPGSIFEDALRMLQFESLAIGALAAWFLFHRATPLHGHWMFLKPTQAVLISLLVLRLLCHRWAAATLPLYAAIFDNAVVAPLLMTTIFAWFILNVSANEQCIVRFEWPALNYLGEISYGIYMYHALAISLVFVPLREKYETAPFLAASVVLHLIVAGLTLVLAALSKKYFEDRFLRLKHRFTPLLDRQATTPTSNDLSSGTPRRLAA
jgi:peptidoglycan/LPS O-acetylase OafA/YrhL